MTRDRQAFDDVAFLEKIKMRRREEAARIDALIERAKEDPSAMQELSDIAYARQYRESSFTEGE